MFSRSYLQIVLFSLLSLAAAPLYAAFGIYQSFGIVGGVFYDLYATTGNPDFNGTNLGTFTTGSSLTFNGGEIGTYRESRNPCMGNVCGGTIYWVVKSGVTPVLSGNRTLNYNSGFGDQNTGFCTVNQQWDNNTGTANILAGLAVGNYTLEVYCEATGSQSSNSGCSDVVPQAALVASFTMSAPAPVELLKFGVTLAEKNAVHLAWETASEHNNHFFEVQHATDGRNWRSIDQVFSHNGNAQYNQSYVFTDRRPAAGANYYRLRQVDTDGNFSFSNVVQVRTGIQPEVHISPNPAGEIAWLGLETTDPDIDTRVQILDAYGRLLREWRFTDLNTQQAIQLDLSGLPAGLLFVRVDGLEAKRLLKQ